MPRMKAEELDFNVKELDDAEYSEDEFEDYDGPEPPKKTRLSGRIKKMWLSETKPETGSKPMLVVIFEADGNTGEREVYNGLTIWERLALIPRAKFRWQPFLDATGLTLRQIKTKMFVAEADDNVGAPIEKIDKFVPGSDDSFVDVITDRERYDGEWRTKIGKYLEFEEQEPDDEDDEDEEDLEDEEQEEEDDEDEDEDEDEADDEEQEEEDEEEEEEDDEPEPPARGRRSASRPAASATKGKAATGRSARTAKAADEKPAAKSSGRSSARTGKAAASKAAAPARGARRGGRSTGTKIDDEPPF